MSKFIIQDWAGNVCFSAKEFDSFEDAWGFIYEKFDHLDEDAFDEEMGEYSVVEKRTIKAKRYLQANDVRGGYINE